MSGTTLGMLARTTIGRLTGADVAFNGVSTDTRKLRAGELFVALSGPHFDGHAFISAARSLGAAGALVGREVKEALPQVVVDDPLTALGVFAKAWRMQFAIPLVALTGSNGKTTTKEMIASILGQRGPVLSTRGNLNNHIGVPLTLLELEAAHWAAVVEMGANHAGEIAYLADLAVPTVGLITNAGPSHLEGFGTVAGVAKAKGEIYEALRQDGCAIINANDAYAPLWRELAGKRRRVEFGVDVDADFQVASADIECEAGGEQRFILNCAVGRHEIRLPLAGRHNVVNALAATAAATAAGASMTDVVKGLATARSVGSRLRVVNLANGARVVDDTYNANPASLQAALQAVQSSRLWLVLGDMGELGPSASALHGQAGEGARAAGVERMFSLGKLSAHATDAFGTGAEHFEDISELTECVIGSLEPGVTVLVKGSRSMRMERIVAALQDRVGVN